MLAGVPFVYTGSKKATARHYPPPGYGTIVEPFAGSAGYSLYWAQPHHRVVLIERDPDVVALWRRLQQLTPAEVLDIECPPIGERTDDLLIALTQPGCALRAQMRSQGTVAITRWMHDQWHQTARYMIAAQMPLLRDWTIIEGDYSEAPNIRGTWFIDPPYQFTGEDAYAHGPSTIDYPRLADWCQSRRGQVIVCEQEGANWLPFRPLGLWRRNSAPATPGVIGGAEVVWTRTPGNMLLTPAARDAAAAASERRTRRVRN